MKKSHLRWTIMFALMAIWSWMPSSVAKTDTKLKTAVSFLKSVQPRATLAQIKKAMPQGVKLGKVRWSPDESPILSGNLMKMNGKISGTLCFLNPSQARILGSGSYPTPQIAKYKSSDPISTVVIDLKGAWSSKAAGLKYLQALERLLGKSKEKRYETPGEDMGGWYSKWKIGGRRTIEYYSAFDALILDFQ